jgi:hypothetical protein
MDAVHDDREPPRQGDEARRSFVSSLLAAAYMDVCRAAKNSKAVGYVETG